MPPTPPLTQPSRAPSPLLKRKKAPPAEASDSGEAGSGAAPSASGEGRGKRARVASAKLKETAAAAAAAAAAAEAPKKSRKKKNPQNLIIDFALRPISLASMVLSSTNAMGPEASESSLDKKRAKDRRFYERHREDRKAKSRQYYHNVGKDRRRKGQAKKRTECLPQLVASLTDAEFLQLRPNLVLPTLTPTPSVSAPDPPPVVSEQERHARRQRAQREIVQIYKKHIGRLEAKVDVWESKWGGTDTWTARAVDFDVGELNARDRKDFEEHILEGTILADEIQEIWRGFDIPADVKTRHGLISKTMVIYGQVTKGVGKLTEM
ncbi:hypothetical protein C8J56DRAFT_881153 [Mycena floridula]|nr:hypothetical protein C8J56DRAFT_881153 [Mycena floridula]